MFFYARVGVYPSEKMKKQYDLWFVIYVDDNRVVWKFISISLRKTLLLRKVIAILIKNRVDITKFIHRFILIILYSILFDKLSLDLSTFIKFDIDYLSLYHYI